MDHFLAADGMLFKLCGAGLTFAVWDLISSYKLEHAEGALEATLSKDPAQFIRKCNAGIPPSCDHLRSALTLAKTYASALLELEDRCSTLSTLLRDIKGTCTVGQEQCADLDSTLREWKADFGKQLKIGPALQTLNSVKAKMRWVTQRSVP